MSTKKNIISAPTLERAKAELYSFHGMNPHEFIHTNYKDRVTTFRDTDNKYVLGSYMHNTKKLTIPAHWKKSDEQPAKQIADFLTSVAMDKLYKEIGFVASIINESYFEELREAEGAMYAHDQIANIAVPIAQETIKVPENGWEARTEDFETYVIRRARELFATIDVKVTAF